MAAAYFPLKCRQTANYVFSRIQFFEEAASGQSNAQIVSVQCVNYFQPAWHRLCKSPVAIENRNEKMSTSGKIITTLPSTAARFETEVLKSNLPVLVVFETPWSRPCQVLDPILEELARDWAGKVTVVKINADDSLDLSLCYDIQSIPTLLCFVAGNLRFRIVGTATKDAILAKLKASGFADSIDTLVKEASGAGAANSKGGLN